MLELLRRLLIRPGLLIELLIASLLANLLALATPLFVIQVLNRYVAHGVSATLTTLATGAVIAIVLEFGFRQVRNRLARGVSLRPDEQVALRGFDALIGSKAGILDQLPPGKQREIMTGVDNIRTAYNAANVSAILDLPFALLFLGVLFFLSPVLGIVATAFTLAALLIGLLLMGLQRTPTRQLTEEGKKTGLLISAAIQEKDTIRAFNGGQAIARAWVQQVRGVQTLFRKIVGQQGILASFSTLITAFMSVTVMGAGAVLVVRGQLDVGALIGANILAARALQPISRFAQLAEPFHKAKQGLQQLREFVQLPRELEAGSSKQTYDGNLELRDLALTYPGATTPLFESLNASIPSGALCVVTGANGAGKSSLARMIMGLVDPSRGQVLADGIDLQQVLPEWWRQQIVYLPQEPGFLNISLADNIKLNNPDLSEEDLNRVIDAAGLRTFVDESQHGMAMPIPNGGRQFAVGIRRRMALARALATKGKLVLMDEPTEGLDSEGLKIVSAALNALHKQGCTIVAFSHDPNIISNAQVVIDLNSKPIPTVMTVAHTQAQETVPQEGQQ